MVDIGIRTLHLRFPNRADTFPLYYTEYQLCLLEVCGSLAVSGKGKKTLTTELNIFLSRKCFLTENDNFLETFISTSSDNKRRYGAAILSVDKVPQTIDR